MLRDEYWMARVLRLAEKGRGTTSPNPMVGAIFVRDDKIIAKGFHKKAGNPHAEIVAINNAKESLKGSTLYINLEPCTHFGKTPPCAPEIVKTGISRAVISMVDPNPLISGKGIKYLQDHNIPVTVGILEEEAKRLNEAFIKFITQKIPFVTLKVATSLDGKIATYKKESKWITSEASRLLVHRLRWEVDAVVVGVNTVIADDPELNVRIRGREENNPIRIILDSSLRIPLGSKIVKNAKDKKSWVATRLPPNDKKVKRLKDLGVKVICLPSKEDKIDLLALMKELTKYDIVHLMIEGGGKVNAAALEAGIVDKVLFFIAPIIIGGENAITAVRGKGVSSVEDAFKLKDVKMRRIGRDFLIEGYIKKEP